MSESGQSEDDIDRTGPGWYVIENPHQDPAKVVFGPTDVDTAETHAQFLHGETTLMHTPALVNAIKHNGYNVEWFEKVEKPQSLQAGKDRSGGDRNVE